MTSFNSLCEDIVTNVLVYVSLKERVKLERVNSEWKCLLRNLWSSQRVLMIIEPRDKTNYLDEQCTNSDHHVRENDIFQVQCHYQKNNYDVLSRDAIAGALARATHLKALYYFHYALNIKLSTLPRTLEHLEIAYKSVFVWDVRKLDRLTCFSSFNDNSRDKYAKELNMFITDNPQLTNVSFYEICREEWLLLLKLKQLESIKLTNGLIAKTLDIFFTETIQECDVDQLVEACPSLKYIDMPVITGHQLMSVNKLEGVVIRCSSSRILDNMLTDIVDKHSNTMKRLRIVLENDNISDILPLKAMAITLEELHVTSYYELDFSQYDYQFPKLHKLSVDIKTPFHDQLPLFRSLFKVFPKLREITIKSDIISTTSKTEVLKILTDYAVLHSKRPINVNAKLWSHSFKPIEFELPGNLVIS